MNDYVLCLPFSLALYTSCDQMIMYLIEKLKVANQFKCLAVVVLSIKIMMILQQSLVASVTSFALHADFKCMHLCEIHIFPFSYLHANLDINLFSCHVVYFVALTQFVVCSWGI